MSDLTEPDVKKVAQLAMLELSDAEIHEMTGHLSKILDYVHLLDAANTEGVEPLAHPIEVTNVFREDELSEMLPREAALQNAPKTDGKYFVVPAILDAE